MGSEMCIRDRAAHVRRDAQLAHGAARSLRAVAALRAAEFGRAPELRARVPAMLSFAIRLLSGSRVGALRGARAAHGRAEQLLGTLRLRPAELLADLLCACAHLYGAVGGGLDGFAGAELDPSLVHKAVAESERKYLLPSAEARLLRALVGRLEQLRARQGRAELRELPDEFVCPITAVLMQEPVRARPAWAARTRAGASHACRPASRRSGLDRRCACRRPRWRSSVRPSCATCSTARPTHSRARRCTRSSSSPTSSCARASTSGVPSWLLLARPRRPPRRND